MSIKYPLKLSRYNLHFGLPAPLKVLHISDSHLLEANEFDSPLKRELTDLRIYSFEHELQRNEPGAIESYFAAIAEYARQNAALVVHTGDLIDFICAGSLARMKKAFAELPMLFTPGNHEYMTEIWPKYRESENPLAWEDVKKILPIESEFYAEIHGGVNFIFVDNANYQFTERQLQRFNEEAERGLPIILLCHVQIHTPENYANYFSPSHPCAYTVGCPVDLMNDYPEELRIQQAPDKATKAFIDGIKKCPELRAVWCGHHHLPFESELFPGVMQRAVGGSYLGYVNEYIID